MEPFVRLDAIAAPLPIANVDTDQILAGRFLKTITREGLGDKLFSALRRRADFVLNVAPWNRAEILIALDNFGCGSSREHAPWALLDFGIRCVIAPRIADIFYNNCFKNGILPIQLPQAQIDRLIRVATTPGTARMTVDLVEQTITDADGEVVLFAIDARRRNDLINGIDDIGRSLGQEASIEAFETAHREQQPWIDEMVGEHVEPRAASR